MVVVVKDAPAPAALDRRVSRLQLTIRTMRRVFDALPVLVLIASLPFAALWPGTARQFGLAWQALVGAELIVASSDIGYLRVER